MNRNIADEYTTHWLLQQEHIVLSHAAIMATAEASLHNSESEEPREALILGSGNCIDIPLDHVVDSFDRIKFVDIDPATTERVLSRLSAQQLGKISLIGADLTGFMAKFAAAMQRFGEENGSYREFIAAATPFIAAIDPARKQPDLGGGYAFVCSQLLLTQLASIPHKFLNEQVVARYDTQLSVQPGGSDEPLLMAYNNLNIKMHASHVAYLAHLVRQSGAVHFADTYAQVAGDIRQPQLLPMVFDDHLKPVVDHHFSEITERQGWLWRPTPDRGYYVVSNSLAPREEVSP